MDKKRKLEDLPVDDAHTAEVKGGFNPQPDPPFNPQPDPPVTYENA